MESNRGRGGGGGRSASTSSRSAAGASGGGGGETAGRGRTTGQRQAGGARGRSSDSAARKGKRPARSSPGQGSSSSAAAIPVRGRPTTMAGSGARRGRGAGGGGRGGRGGAAATGGDSYANLGTLVSKATKPTRETGYRRLDEEIVRRIKAVAKTDDNCAAGAIRYLMQRMAAKSAEVRFMALSIVGVLFQRSKVARKVVVADLKNFMNLAVGHDARQPLPGPPNAAAALRQKALSLMEEWNGSHGDLYKGLRAAYRFLREGKRMKFPELQAMAVRERQAAARRDKHAQRLLQAKYLQAKAEITEQAPEIETMVREMQECFAILVPLVPGADAISTGQGNSVQGPPGTGDIQKRDDRIGGGGSGSGGGGDGGEGGGGVSTPLLPGRVAHTAGAAGDGDRRGGDGGGVGNADEGEGGGGLLSSSSSSSSEREKTGPRGAEEEGGGTGGRTEPERSSGEPGIVGDGDEGAGDVGRTEGEDDSHSSSNDDANNVVKGPSKEQADDGEADSDEDEGMEWEEGDGGAAGSDGDIGGGPDVGGEEGAEEDDRETNGEEGEEGEEEEEEEEEELWRNGKRRRVEGQVRGDSNELRTIADTVEAAGLGSSGYELQVEVPMGWSVRAGDDGDVGGGDTSLVVSALRERYKVMTSRLLPLVSDWIQTLSRVHFDDDDNNNEDSTNSSNSNTGSTTSTTSAMIAANTGGEGGRRHTAAASASAASAQSAAAPGRSAPPVSVSERRTCAGLLGRCLATRNSANTLVSKFIELRLDEDGAGRGGGEGLNLAASVSVSSASKKKRLKIQLDGAGETGRTRSRQVEK